jgi:site-specific recombinase XerD
MTDGERFGALITVIGPPAEASVSLESAAAYAAAEKSEATRRAYAGDFADFRAWCESRSVSALPAAIETAAAYLAHLADAGLRVSTISRRTAAIAYAHRLAGVVSPIGAEPVKAVLRGIRRKLGAAAEQKAPATAQAVRAMLKHISADTLIGKRDRAVILLGFAAALRRSELVALEVRDIERTPQGIIVHVRRSKTDQAGEGHQVAVLRGSKLKPVEALDVWLAAAGIVEGRLFPVSAQTVALIVKRAAQAAKLDPAFFSGHSLRAGFVTSALENGADVLKVMDVTRHKSVQTLKGYDRKRKPSRITPAKGSSEAPFAVEYFRR